MGYVRQNLSVNINSLDIIDYEPSPKHALLSKGCMFTCRLCKYPEIMFELSCLLCYKLFRLSTLISKYTDSKTVECNITLIAYIHESTNL